MKKLSLITLFLFCGLTLVNAAEKVKLSVSEPDAVIYVDGKAAGASPIDIKIENNSCVSIKIVKTGFLTENLSFCDKKNAAIIPKTLYVELKRDDSYDASLKIDFANNDIDVHTTKSEADAWRLLNQIITSQFDVIEITDKETGYLRTSWAVQTFRANTV